MLMDNVFSDVQFFLNQKIIDYSLLVGIMQKSDLKDEQLELIEALRSNGSVFFSKNGEFIYFLSIIDYFQLYTFNKFIEKNLKKLYTLNFKLNTSSQPAHYYSNRFLNYIKRIIPYDSD